MILPPRNNRNTNTFALYMALFKNRDQLKNFLIKKGIEVKIHYPVPLHLQKPAIEIGYKRGDFPIAEYQAKSLLTLPVHQYLKRKQLNYITNSIEKFYKKK